MSSSSSVPQRTRTERIQILRELWEKVTQESDARPGVDSDHVHIDQGIEEIESGRIGLDLDL